MTRPRRIGPAPVVLALAALGGAAHAHGTSKSYAEWRIEGRSVHARVAFAAHDLVGAYPEIDADEDGALQVTELAEHADWLGPRIAAGAEVRAGRTAPEAACPLVGTAVRGLADPVEEVQVELSYRCEGLVGAARVRARLLPELEPPHVSVATLVGPGLDATHVFTKTSPQVDLLIELPSLGEALAAAGRRLLSRLSRPAPLLLGLALICLAGRPRAGARGLVFGVAAASSAALAAPEAAIWGSALALAGAAGLVLRGVHGAWALGWTVAAGALFGWGARAGDPQELPVRIALSGALVLAPAALSAVAGWGLAGRSLPRRGQQAVATGLAVAALVVLGLAVTAGP